MKIGFEEPPNLHRRSGQWAHNRSLRTDRHGPRTVAGAAGPNRLSALQEAGHWRRVREHGEPEPSSCLPKATRKENFIQNGM